jgi:hypothetical protein
MPSLREWFNRISRRGVKTQRFFFCPVKPVKREHAPTQIDVVTAMVVVNDVGRHRNHALILSLSHHEMEASDTNSDK